MVKRLFIAVLLLPVLMFGELVVYTYDSMVSGLARKIEPLFEKKYGVDVKFVSFGDAGATLSKVILEGKKTDADVILGLDQNLLLKAKEEGVLFPYKPSRYKEIKKGLLDEEFFAVPFDYGAIAIVYDSKVIKDPPKSFEDLLKPEFRRKIVVEDPRTSSTGLAFLLWTIGVYGEEGFKEYWQKLKDNLLTVTPGWDEAFEMLENGEADMMVSYLTDAAYSYYYYKSLRYKPAVFKEGMYVQVEYVGICRFTDDLDLAKKFIDFMLSDEVQQLIPLSQWMLPVVKVKLPDVFEKYVPEVDKVVTVDAELVKKNMKRWLKEWEKIVSGY